MGKPINIGQEYGCWDFHLALITTFIALNDRSCADFNIKTPLRGTHRSVDEQGHQI